MPRPGRFTPGKDPVPIVQEAGWAPGLVWRGAENPAPTGIRSLDRPARSESLYRPSYPGPYQMETDGKPISELLGVMFNTTVHSAKGRWTSGRARNMKHKYYLGTVGAI